MYKAINISLLFLLVIMVFTMGCRSNNHFIKKTEERFSEQVMITDDIQRNIHQVLINKNTDTQLEYKRTLRCEQAVNCLVFGKEIASVVFSYRVLDINQTQGGIHQKVLTLINSTYEFEISTHDLLDVILAHVKPATHSAKGLKGSILFINEPNLNMKRFILFDDYFPSIGSINLDCEIDKLWDEIINKPGKMLRNE